jgi:hypothetical protein
VVGVVPPCGERPAELLRGAQGLVAVPTISKQASQRSTSPTHAKTRSHRASKPHASKPKPHAEKHAQAPAPTTPRIPSRPQTTTVVHATVASSRPSSSAAGEFGFEGP